MPCQHGLGESCAAGCAAGRAWLAAYCRMLRRWQGNCVGLRMGGVNVLQPQHLANTSAAVILCYKQSSCSCCAAGLTMSSSTHQRVATRRWSVPLTASGPRLSAFGTPNILHHRETADPGRTACIARLALQDQWALVQLIRGRLCGLSLVQGCGWRRSSEAWTNCRMRCSWRRRRPYGRRCMG